MIDRFLKTISITGLAFLFCLMAGNAQALDNATFDKLFSEYDESLETFVTALTSGNWSGANTEAAKIVAQSKHMMELAKKDTNKNWIYDVTNLYHHSEELKEASEEKDAVESVFLVGILAAHIGYVQSANPKWLLEEVGKKIAVMEKGITEKNREATRDAAEIVHSSSNKIVLSSGTMKHIYVHTRWLGDIRKLNGWGDSIIGEVNSNDWKSPAKKLPKIKRAYGKWKKAFKK